MKQRRLGAVVRRLRRREHLTQDRLAARAGITQAAVSRIESGARQNPGVRTLVDLAHALGVPVTELPIRRGRRKP